MNVLHTSASAVDEGASPVRMIGVGAAGRCFVQQFFAKPNELASGPSEDLLDEEPIYFEIEHGGAPTVAEELNLNHVRILCLVFGVDVRPAEIEAAMFLIWRAWEQDAQVVGVVLGAETRGRVDGDSMLGILLKSIEARIDVPASWEPDDLAAVQWFYAAIRRSVLDGDPFLEPAWDQSDVIEVLDFREVQLILVTQCLDRADQLDTAMEQALQVVDGRGVEIEQAHGVIIVLWVQPGCKITGQAVRNLGRMVGNALGAGGMHLTVRLRSRVTASRAAACLTLVVSSTRVSAEH